MSYTAMINVRGVLISSSSVTSNVSASNIRVGWPRELESFPSILITQSYGSDDGFLGYKTGGLRREGVAVQLDIFATTRTESLNIGDSIVPVMISSLAARKDADVDSFDDNLNVYRKIQTYSFTMEHDDY